MSGCRSRPSSRGDEVARDAGRAEKVEVEMLRFSRGLLLLTLLVSLHSTHLQLADRSSMRYAIGIASARPAAPDPTELTTIRVDRAGLEPATSSLQMKCSTR